MATVHYNRSAIDPNKNIIVYTHIGIGDMICNYAIFKTIVDESYGNIIIPCRQIFLDSMTHLYKDEPRVSFLPVSYSTDVHVEIQEIYNYAEENNLEIFQFGFSQLTNQFHYKQFFDLVDIPYRQSWEIFPKFESTKNSKQLYDSLSLDGKDYILKINTNTSGTFDLKIDSNLHKVAVFKSEFGTGIFDWIDVIKNANEIHTVGTGIFHLIDRIENFNKDCKLYFHNARQDFHTIDTKLKWNLIEYE